MNGRVRRWMVLCLPLLVVVGAQGVSAEPASRGGYLGLGPAVAFENFGGSGPSGIDEAWGFDAWGGYRINPWIAVELQLEYLNGFDYETLGFDVDGEAVNFHANVKAFPLSAVLPPSFQPFLRVGPGLTWFEFSVDDLGIDVDNEDFSARFGGGVDVYLSPRIAFHVSSNYVLPTGDVEDLDHVDVIFGFQFLIP